MKRILIFPFFLCAYVFSQNNIIPNYNLERAQPGKFPQCDYQTNLNAFNSDIENWRVAEHNVDKGSGTADWLTYNNCANPGLCGANNNQVNSTRQILICSDIYKCKNKTSDFLHEAVAVSLENNAKFVSGKNYILRYKISPSKAKILSKAGNLKTEAEAICNLKSLTSHMRVFLSEKGYKNWNKNSSQKQELINANYQKNNSTALNCDYTIEERKFIPNSGVYTTLVLYAESGGMLIDDIEVFEECEDTYYIQNKSYENPFYLPNSVNGLYNFTEKSSNQIIAGNNVTSSRPNGNVVIKKAPFNLTSPYIIYTATNRIILKSGFKAESGTRFRAVTLPCPNNLNKGGYEENSNPNYIPLDPLPTDEESVSAENNFSINSYVNFNIIPNPNNGNFSIYINDELELPKSINIRNTLLQTIQIINNIDSYVTEINLKDFPNGIYIIEINYPDKIITSKVIKNL